MAQINFGVKDLARVTGLVRHGYVTANMSDGSTITIHGGSAANFEYRRFHDGDYLWVKTRNRDNAVNNRFQFMLLELLSAILILRSP